MEEKLFEKIDLAYKYTQYLLIGQVLKAQFPEDKRPCVVGSGDRQCIVLWLPPVYLLHTARHRLPRGPAQGPLAHTGNAQ